jgi:hypothetical protein
MIVFALLAIVGFTASVVVHLASWGTHPLGIGQTWPLHIGIFVTFAPAVMGQKQGGVATSFKAMMPQAPRWMTAVLTVCVADCPADSGALPAL